MAYFRCKGAPPEEPIETFAWFSGNGHIELPFTVNENYRITVDFEPDYYNSNAPVIGNNSGAAYSHLTPFSDKWYTSNGSTEVNFQETLTGRHTFVFNDNGVNTFDGTTVVSTVNPYSSDSMYYWIAGRSGASRQYIGKIYNYKIEDLSLGTTICEIKAIIYNGEPVFRDIINNVTYTCNGMMVFAAEQKPYKPAGYPFKDEYTVYGWEKIGIVSGRRFKRASSSNRAVCVGSLKFGNWGHPFVLISDDPTEVDYYYEGTKESGYAGTIDVKGKTYYYGPNGGLFMSDVSCEPAGSIPYVGSFSTYAEGVAALVQAALIDND